MSDQDHKEVTSQKGGQQRPSINTRQTILEYLQERNDDSPGGKFEHLIHSGMIIQINNQNGTSSHGHSGLFSTHGVNDDPSIQSEFALEMDDMEEAEEDYKDNERFAQSYTKLIIENDKLISEAPFFHEYSQVATVVLQLLNTREKYIFPLSECMSLTLF